MFQLTGYYCHFLFSRSHIWFSIQKPEILINFPIVFLPPSKKMLRQ
jgi:hypothetical protein